MSEETHAQAASPEVRQKKAETEFSQILVTKGIDPTTAKEAAKEIVAAGFCIVGGGVPIGF